MSPRVFGLVALVSIGPSREAEYFAPMVVATALVVRFVPGSADARACGRANGGRGLR